MSVFDPPPQDEGPWLSVSDLMSGLMLVFLCIAVFFMIQVKEDEEDAQRRRVAVIPVTLIEGDTPGIGHARQGTAA